ncbi:unnamed protein product [Caenorhabditis auriculariae]|uniref:Uncharacterized protein n=1 Tax=Caenorhabditis auriculariae TaxID=2777116 RepID=A0A8S1HHY9_9PELO|nr:unnamed protein product [Caenorhabditis auriculariae]
MKYFVFLALVAVATAATFQHRAGADDTAALLTGGVKPAACLPDDPLISIFMDLFKDEEVMNVVHRAMFESKFNFSSYEKITQTVIRRVIRWVNNNKQCNCKVPIH